MCRTAWVLQVFSLLVMLLARGAYAQDPRQGADTAEGARRRAEALIAALQKGDWREAARYVHLDRTTEARMGIPHSDTRDEARLKVEALFRSFYGSVRPGSVVSVTIDENDSTRAVVEYRHEDLDAFTMSYVNGDWFYVLERGGPRERTQAAQSARRRAEALTAVLRKGDWREAARFVHLDADTRRNMRIPSGASFDKARPKIEAWFRKLYRLDPPGGVESVRINTSDPTLAKVSYLHAFDVDGFTMRFVNGDWFYVAH
jgi:hypothetical protein